MYAVQNLLQILDGHAHGAGDNRCHGESVAKTKLLVAQSWLHL